MHNGQFRSVVESASLRLPSMAVRLGFILFASSAMEPHAFGRFALIQAGSQIAVTVVGIELYQIMLRRIVQGTAVAAARTRLRYAGFVVVTGIPMALLGLVAPLLAGWGTAIAILTALVALFEYWGLECARWLIAENRPVLSTATIVMRTGAWPAILMAWLMLRGQPFLSLHTLLLAWIGADLISISIALPVLARGYLRPQPMGAILRTGLVAARLALPWAFSTLAWRVMESGGRFAVAFFWSEAQAGRYALLSTIASVGFVAYKGTVEVVYYSRLAARDGHHAACEFHIATASVLLFGAISAMLLVPLYNRFSNASIGAHELWPLILLIVGFLALGFSHLPHFALYRLRRDSAIIRAQGAGAFACILLSIALTPMIGLAGASAAFAISALAMCAVKLHASVGANAASELRTTAGN